MPEIVVVTVMVDGLTAVVVVVGAAAELTADEVRTAEVVGTVEELSSPVNSLPPIMLSFWLDLPTPSFR